MTYKDSFFHGIHVTGLPHMSGARPEQVDCTALRGGMRVRGRKTAGGDPRGAQPLPATDTSPVTGLNRHDQKMHRVG